MKHLGDITRISGADAPRVEVIIGGSPCQDLSIAGKRAGLAGERSGLFMEQIRIIKELRQRDIDEGRTGGDVFPRYMVWENVPGALSSGAERGEDFRAVLEETARVADNRAAIPRYEGGSWRTSGVIVGDGWSIAWRVHDAQFWGVPQRRRRISLVADFAGDTAPRVVFDLLRGGASDGYPVAAVGRAGAGDGPEIRFVADSLRWDLEESGAEREGDGSGSAGGAYPAVAGTLRARMDGSPCPDRGNGAPVIVAFQANQRDEIRDLRDCAGALAAEPGMKQKTFVIQGNCIDRADTAGCNGRGWRDDDISFTLNTVDRPAVYDARGNGDGRICPTITGDHQNSVTDYTAICIGNGQAGNISMSQIGNTLDTMHDQQAVIVTAVDCRNMTENGEVNGTLQSKTNGGTSLNLQNVCRVGQTVRRLTPLECERLQGYLDGWTDIGDWTDSRGKKRKTSDAARYKALGNSIALPFWRVMLGRLIRYCREGTMASLFDGIGGFPLCWRQVGGVTVWASEIEEFPMAVTRFWFGEE